MVPWAPVELLLGLLDEPDDPDPDEPVPDEPVPAADELVLDDDELVPDDDELVPDVDDPLPDDDEPLPDEPVPDEPVPDDDELLPVCVTAAWLEPGSIAATAPAATTLAAVRVTVVALSRRRPCARSATPCATWRAADRSDVPR